MDRFVDDREFQRGNRMQVSVGDAKGQLTELVRSAEAGDEVILTRHGQAAVRLVPIRRVRCLVLVFDGALFSQEWRDAL